MMLITIRKTTLFIFGLTTTLITEFNLIVEIPTPVPRTKVIPSSNYKLQKILAQ
jgi:hypothetical protein